MIGRYSNVLHC